MKLAFLDRVFKNTQMSNFMKIHPMGAELVHADVWMDGQHCEANSCFLQLCQLV